MHISLLFLFRFLLLCFCSFYCLFVFVCVCFEFFLFVCLFVFCLFVFWGGVCEVDDCSIKMLTPYLKSIFPGTKSVPLRMPRPNAFYDLGTQY